MSDDQLSDAIAVYRALVTAYEKWQRYLASGNGLPKEELERLRLMFSNVLSVAQFKRHITDLRLSFLTERQIRAGRHSQPRPATRTDGANAGASGVAGSTS